MGLNFASCVIFDSSSYLCILILSKRKEARAYWSSDSLIGFDEPYLVSFISTGYSSMSAIFKIVRVAKDLTVTIKLNIKMFKTFANPVL